MAYTFNKLFFGLMTLLEAMFLVSAAVLHPARQVQSLQQTTAHEACPVITVNNYITVTVTALPNTVTVAIPDYASISRSLASASTVESIVVVENSINRPANAPPNTIIPTFIDTIYAPAVEVTESMYSGSSAFFLPGTHQPETIAIGATTHSIILSPKASTAIMPTAPSNSSSSKTYTAPMGGWNETLISSTAISSVLGTGSTPGQGPTSTVTATTYVNTTTAIFNTIWTAPPSYTTASGGGYSGYGGLSKRQTCTLVSAQIDGHWASWCNNWDGSTTLTYTSWEITVTPGAEEGSQSIMSSAVTSTDSSTVTVSVTGSPTTMTMSLVSSSPSIVTPSTSAVATSQAPDPSCGQVGPFTISFDDLPRQSVSDNEAASLPPIFSPYQHFFWAADWSYLPPPKSAYQPHDSETLGIYVEKNLEDDPTNPGVDYIPPGGFGAGRRSPNDAYWFDAHSMWAGCDNSAVDETGYCDFVAEGYRWDIQSSTNRLHTTAHFPIRLCLMPYDCQLQEIRFPEQFTQLSTISFYAKVGPGKHLFYVDELQFSWWNNTCAAGLERVSSRKNLLGVETF